MTDSVSIYKLGIYGKAYDVPGTCRAYTYQHQPDNQGAWRLGEAMSIASKAGGGDYIDTGLGLLKQLELKGYGVYELGEVGTPEMEPAHNPEHTLFNEIRTSTPVSEDGEPVRYIITEQQLQRIYSLENTRRIHLEMVSVYAEGCRGIIEGLRAALHSCAKASSAAEVGLIVDGVLAAARAPEWQRCQTCDGTGDVHRADGEYLGECHCSKAHKAAIEAGDLMAIAEECGAGRMAENVAQVTRCDLGRIIQFVRNQQVEQQKPVGSVFTMQPCFPGEPKRAHAQLHVVLPAGTKLYAEPQQSQVNRIPAGLYAELEALRTLRDATGVYLQGYMRDEIEDEDNCVTEDQHDAACTVKLALDKARELEWKGGGEGNSHG
ncbi:conserved protein of unknown function [Ectopseudomonas oleovorans]|uniref:Uncharacterized protein n=1 Tax=Ectopseudomonas oleovorans TaxID=301 RepID=A0A653B0G3_ECTOL|nr:conserved protein of unknown function [Pseudomonas oleovorans]